MPAHWRRLPWTKVIFLQSIPSPKHWHVEFPAQGGGGDSAGPRMPTTPNHQGLVPTPHPPHGASGQQSVVKKYQPQESMGTEGARWSTNTRTT